MKFKVLGNDSKLKYRIVKLYPMDSETKENLSNLGDDELYGYVTNVTNPLISGELQNLNLSFIEGTILNLNKEFDKDYLSFSTPTYLTKIESQKFKDTYPGFFL